MFIEKLFVLYIVLDLTIFYQIDRNRNQVVLELIY